MPTTVTKPIMLDETGRRIATALEGQNAGVSGIILPVASGFSDEIALTRGTSVYRVAPTPDENGAVTIPTPDATAIPTEPGYYCFELEVAVDSGATALVGPGAADGWTWMPDGSLPSSGFEESTIHVAARLDCTARTVIANVWRVE